jgi:hypothetical protein
MQYPDEWILSATRRRRLLWLIILMLALMVALQRIDRPLKTTTAPAGIVSFEFAGDLPQALRILDSWGERGRSAAGLSLGLDYLFLVVYASTIACGCTLIARHRYQSWPGFARLGKIAAWAVCGAAILDAFENYALIRLLMGVHNPWYAPIAWWCAALKFLFVVGGLGYIAVGALSILGDTIRTSISNI